MSSTFSTQNRHTFLRRKYCFLPVANALSPPVGRWDALIGLPPLCSAIVHILLYLVSGSNTTGSSTVAGAGGVGGTGGLATGAPGIGAPGVGPAGAGAPGSGAPGPAAGAAAGISTGAGLRAARFSRIF